MGSYLCCYTGYYHCQVNVCAKILTEWGLVVKDSFSYILAFNSVNICCVFYVSSVCVFLFCLHNGFIVVFESMYFPDVRLKTKFWGKSMEVQPLGLVNLKLAK